MRTLWRWLEDRLEFDATVFAVLRHPVPAALGGRIGWWYVFGATTLAVFIVQIVTGVGLAMTYVPAPNSAYDTLQFISHDATLGGLVRGIHYWGAGAMVVLVLIHMSQVFLFGAYKYPREINWLSGSVLLLLTLAMAFTGQLLRWDQDAFWAIVVAAEQAARAPILGDLLARLVVAGQTVGGATLTRFYATHVFLIPAAMFGLIGLHLYLVIRRGVSEPPEPGDPVRQRTYKQRYEQLLRRGIPFYPDAAYRDAIVAAVAVIAVVVLAVVVGAPALGKPADPTVVVADPRPDWYFLGYFALLALIPPGAESLVIIGLPTFAVLYLFALPLLFPVGERHWSRRPAAIAVVTIPFVIYTALTIAGFSPTWVPVLGADARLPDAVTAGLAPSERHGAQLFIDKSCFACHQISGAGGRRGPDLTDVASRITRERIVERILNGGGGAMPSYAASMTPQELDDLVAFLETRHAP
jgi:ubiquinol-cytochrome c reductase cytochrome b subunit